MKKRIDQLLVEKKLVSSREKAKSLISNKKVLVDKNYVLKPSTIVDDESNIKILEDIKFVSRAGYKLEKALNKFKIKVENLICLDVGSSTGGFTDCLLQHKAKLVYALDVGTNQLVWKLRNNSKVISMEKTNFRYSKKNDFKNDINFACMDVSFISVTKLLDSLSNILENNSYAIILVKPQFEAGKDEVKNGKILNKNTHLTVLKEVMNNCIIKELMPLELDYSPILGNKKGNIEYILLIQKKEQEMKLTTMSNNSIQKIIDEAWKNFSI